MTNRDQFHGSLLSFHAAAVESDCIASLSVENTGRRPALVVCISRIHDGFSRCHLCPFRHH
jgi:hypothetical protein